MDAVVGKMTQLTVEAQQCSGPDPEGDVVLKCQDHDTGTMMSFRVSSKVLRLASPVFVRMFSSSFREGHELLQEECVVVELEDDDASLMNILLNVLHYQAGYEDHVIDAEKLARLAIHCDKYDCTKALAPWVSIWFKDIKEPGQPPVDFGFQILAAYMFNNAKKFEEISKAALEEMAPEFSAQWMQQDILKLLPDRISAITINVV
ncbi:Nn.00g104500.m01.CDS01 [Neocucurbitaria sp. VM-36]